MTVELHDAVDRDGLFDVLGSLFKTQDVLDTARGTTVPAQTDALVLAWDALGNDPVLAAILGPVAGAQTAWQTGGNVFWQTFQTAAKGLVIDLVDMDATLVAKTLAEAIKELVRQMVASGDSVQASAVTATAAAVAGNYGNGVILVSTKGGDGKTRENIYGEAIAGTAVSAGLGASIAFRGKPGALAASEQWPAGSATSKSIVATDAADSLIANGDFEDETGPSNIPDDWIVSVGTVGTTALVTNPEVQQIAITGTPTAGYVLISWADPDGHTQTTDPIAFDATAAQVQSALRLLSGLELVTVASSGTAPNLTHTITFTGKGGNVSQVTVTNYTTAGTYTPSTVTAGTGLVFAGGKSVQFASNGAQLWAINGRLSGLAASTCYGISIWGAVDIAPLAGVVTVELIDGVGGSVLNDPAGNANSFTFPVTSLGATWAHISTIASGQCVFRTPVNVPPIVYLRIRVSTAIDNGTSLFLDNVAVAQMTELYPGGPLVAAFGGSKPFKVGDAWTITATNNRAGAIQEAFNRNFDMSGLGYLLPSNSLGAETLPDSLIA